MISRLHKAGPLIAALLLAACSGGSGGGSGSGNQDGAGAGNGNGGNNGGAGGNGQPTQLYSVGGKLSGLGDGKAVVLGDASGPRVSVGANGTYRIQMGAGTAYRLEVLTQPTGQTCTFTRNNHQGTASADVDDIDLACQDSSAAPGSLLISGTVTGLGAGQGLALQLQSGGQSQQVQVGPDGRFTFPVPVDGDYQISVVTQPPGMTCSVTEGQGHTKAAGGTRLVTVTCVPSAVAYRLSGTMAGNSGTVVLHNSGTGESVTVLSNGQFAFTQALTAGSTYAVTVASAVSSVPGATQACSVANGSGTARADVTVAVTCATTPAPEVPTVPQPAATPPSTPTGITSSYDVRAIKIAWPAVTAPAGGGQVTYRVFEDVDGPGPAVPTQIATGLTGKDFTVQLGNLLERVNATYTVQACNANGCSAASAPLVLDMTKAVGYFKASNNGVAEGFGLRVALSSDGTTMVVGTNAESSSATGINGNQADNSASAAGAAYVFVRTGNVWAQQAYLKASNTAAGQEFGISVAVSGDGNTVAVGAWNESSKATGINGDQTDTSAHSAGAVYVFARSGAAWSQQAYVKASNAAFADMFGSSVALSGSGDVLAVGAPYEQSNSTGVNGAPNNTLPATTTGAAYLFVRQGANWSQQAHVKPSTYARDRSFGYAVALSLDGRTLAVGGPWDPSNATGINGDSMDTSLSSDAGAVWVFTQTGNAWAQQAYVKASNTAKEQLFGSGVSLSSDGSTLAVSAPGEDSKAAGINGDQSDHSQRSAGAVYVFSRSGLMWSQQAYIKASNTDGMDLLGGEFPGGLALSADGNTLAVGAVGESSAATGINGAQNDNTMNESGAVYVFTRSAAGLWSQKAYVKAPNTQKGAWFGTAVALTSDGKTLVVGTPNESSNAKGVGGDRTDRSMPGAGAVFLY